MTTEKTTYEELDLQENELISIPGSIGKLVPLEKLGLWCDALTPLPGSIGKLVNLKKMNLRENK